MPGPFQFEGELESTPVAEVLTTVLRHRVPGRLEVSRDEVTKHLWIVDGTVVAAASDDRDDRLGTALYREGKLTPEDLETVARDKEETGRQVGRILIDRRILTPAELKEALCEQMHRIVWSVFGWSEGSLRFEIGSSLETGRVRISLPLREVILRGLEATPGELTRGLIGRLGKRNTVFRATWSVEEVVELGLGREEMELLRLVDGEASLADLCESGPRSRTANARLLYAYRLLGLIEPVDPGAGALKIRLAADRQPPSES